MATRVYIESTIHWAIPSENMTMQGIEKIKETFGNNTAIKVAKELETLDRLVNALRAAAPQLTPGGNEEYALLTEAQKALDEIYKNKDKVVDFVRYAFGHNESYVNVLWTVRRAIAMSHEQDEDRRDLGERLAG